MRKRSPPAVLAAMATVAPAAMATEVAMAPAAMATEATAVPAADKKTPRQMPRKWHLPSKKKQHDSSNAKPY